jgi:hypothetical protein
LTMLNNLFVISLVASTISIQTVGAQTPANSDPYVKRWESKLSARIQWDILWKKVPEGFKTPSDSPPTAFVVVDSAKQLISYCSHDLGVCASYRLFERTLTEFVRAGGSGEDNRKSVLRFIEGEADTKSSNGSPRGPLRGLAGNGRTLFDATLEIGTADTIRDYYRKQKPVQLPSLIAWASEKFDRFSSLHVPCFVASDPEIIIYGERIGLSPAVVSVEWSSEDEIWVDGWYVDEREDPKMFAEYKRTIDSIACATIALPRK